MASNINKYMNYMIIGLAFCLPISKAGIVFFEVLLIISWMVELDFKYKIEKLRKSKFLVGLAIFILFSCISLVWSSNTEFALIYLKKYWHFLVIPVIYTSLNRKYINPVFSAFLLGMLLSEFVSYAIFFELITYKDVLPSSPSPFMNHSNYSLFLAMASMILLNKIFSSTELKYKIMYSVYFITTVSNLFLNGGRTGQIIFFIALVVIVILNLKNKIQGLVISTLLSLSILTSAYIVSPVFKARFVHGVTDVKKTLFENDYKDSFGQRVSLWILGANVAIEHLPLGTGIGDEKNGMQKYVKKHNLNGYTETSESGYIDYHSMYIQYFVQLGIIGLVLVSYLMYSLFKLHFISLLHRNINISFCISIFIFSTVSMVLHIMVAMTFFAFFAAIMSAISRIENEETTNSI